MTDIALADWVRLVKEIESPRILHCGQKMWPGSQVYNRVSNAPHGIWVASDIISSQEVEFVANLETLVSDMESQRVELFDAVYCASVLEHVRRPWLAVQQMANSVNVGCPILINTHQTFPVHNYPSDYFRFTIESLKSMASDSNMRVISCCYLDKCTITPPRNYGVWNPAAEAWLGVSMCAVRHV